MDSENKLMTFSNKQLGKVRVLERDGQTWFVASDVCKILNIGNTTNVMKRIDDDSKAIYRIKNITRGNDSVNFVNEYGLYNLILGSRKKEAVEIKHWITHEVLPDIRKRGLYATEKVVDNFLSDPDSAIRVFEAYKSEKQKRLALEKKVALDAPLVEFANHVSNTSDLIDIGQLAKIARDEHIDIGRNRLFEWMRKNGLIMMSKPNMPYQRYIDQGIFVVKEMAIHTSYGEKVYPKVYITGKGQIYIVEKLRNEYSDGNTRSDE